MAEGNGFFAETMTRRRALGLIGGSMAACAAGVRFPRFSYASGRPNIIFILSDDHRWDAMSNMGHPVVQTPSLDRLASQGVRFNNAFVTTSLCSPSRASFLTGQYARTHGVQNNLTPWRNDNVTFLELLKKTGYDTAFIGKWHMPGRLPALRGVDRFITFTVQEGQGRYFDCPLIVDGREEPSLKPYITEELTDRALEFMNRKRANPFCLYLSHKAVHHRFLPPPEMQNLYNQADLHLPPEADSWISWAKGQVWTGVLGPLEREYRNYLATLTALDRQIGRVIDWVDNSGQAQNTVIVYAGDNGYFWGEHRFVDKRWAYEEAIRVPFIVRCPDLVNRPGQPADQMALNVDLAPTLLEMAGLPIPSAMEGTSLVPLLRDRGASGRRAWMYEYFKDFPYNTPEHQAVRTRRHKFIRFQGGRPEELYDLARDPREMTNLIGTAEGVQLRPELAAMLEKLRRGVRL